MSDDSQPELSDLQAEVLRLLGHCLIRLQRYEMGLKALLQASDIRIEPQAGSEAQLKHGIETEKNTLGALVAKFLDLHLVTESSEHDEDAVDKAEISVRARRYVTTSAQNHREVRDELRSFVLLRNHLVHHFIEGKNLTNSDDCRSALQELTAAMKAIEKQISKLSHLAKIHDDTSRMITEQLSQSWVLEFMLGRAVPWEITDIVADLRAAEEKLSLNGWTQLSKAAKWMAANRPDQSPQNYGCVSWQQVLHESKLFELTYLKRQEQRIRCYRSKLRPSLN